MNDITTVTVKLRVRLNDLTAHELEENIETVIQSAIVDGAITQGSDADLQGWSITTNEVIPEIRRRLQALKEHIEGVGSVTNKGCTGLSAKQQIDSILGFIENN